MSPVPNLFTFPSTIVDYVARVAQELPAAPQSVAKPPPATRSEPPIARQAPLIALAPSGRRPNFDIGVVLLNGRSANPLRKNDALSGKKGAEAIKFISDAKDEELRASGGTLKKSNFQGYLNHEVRRQRLMTLIPDRVRKACVRSDAFADARSFMTNDSDAPSEYFDAPEPQPSANIVWWNKPLAETRSESLARQMKSRLNGIGDKLTDVVSQHPDAARAIKSPVSTIKAMVIKAPQMQVNSGEPAQPAKPTIDLGKFEFENDERPLSFDLPTVIGVRA